MKNMLLPIGFIVAILAILFFLGLSVAQRITLVVEAPIEVKDRASVQVEQTKTIAILQPGARVSVSACVDLKSFVALEIDLPQRQVGYVLAGKFHLERESAWPLHKGPIVFSCQ